MQVRDSVKGSCAVLTWQRCTGSLGMAPIRVTDSSWHHYKVFTHLWLPPELEEARLVVVSKVRMDPTEIKAVLVRSGRAVAGTAWIEETDSGNIEGVSEYETPEDYVLIGELPLDAEGVMPPRPTDRDPTADYPFEHRP